MTQKTVLPYPDNLWQEVFGNGNPQQNQTVPVPEDAIETLDLLLMAEERPVVRQVLDWHFKEGKTLTEISKLINRSTTRVKQYINEATRKMRNPRYSRIHGATLRYGLQANQMFVDGRAEVCCECGKIIEEGNYIFIVPDNDLSSNPVLSFSPKLKVCCSQECADCSKQKTIAEHEQLIAVLKLKIQENEEAIKALEEYQCKPSTYEDARKALQESDIRVDRMS